MICTKNRASQLKQCLKEIANVAKPPCDLEIILVDNGSDDTSKDVIKDFMPARHSRRQPLIVRSNGLGWKINFGLSAAKGEWLLFTDDDCYPEKVFFRNFCEFVTFAATSPEAKEIKFGSGPILPYDKQHDPRLATLLIEK